jgi:hypothetical protein
MVYGGILVREKQNHILVPFFCFFSEAEEGESEAERRDAEADYLPKLSLGIKIWHTYIHIYTYVCYW